MSYNKTIAVNGQDVKVAYSFQYSGVRRDRVSANSASELDYRLTINGTEMIITRFCTISKNSRVSQSFGYNGQFYKSEKKLAEAVVAHRPELLK